MKFSICILLSHIGNVSSITMIWTDKRYIEGVRNLHRLTGCPSNHVPYDDAFSMWEPQPKVINALELVTPLYIVYVNNQKFN